MSVSTRTAGFTMYDLSKYRDVSLLIMIILMFVGASPGGTGGGVKTTTIALLFYYIRSIVTDRDPHTFRRSLNRGLIRKALLIILLGLLFFLIGLFIICFCEFASSNTKATTGTMFPNVLFWAVLLSNSFAFASFIKKLRVVCHFYRNLSTNFVYNIFKLVFGGQYGWY